VSALTFRRTRRDPRPGRLMRVVLDPAGRPRTGVRWAIALAGTAVFAVAFAFSASGTRTGPAGAGAPTRAPLVSGADGPAPGIGNLHPLPALPALARAPRRHHRVAHRKAPPIAVPAATATPRAPVARPVATAVPRARKQATPGPVFDTSG
jgi:hypothetical protein